MSVLPHQLKLKCSIFCFAHQSSSHWGALECPCNGKDYICTDKNWFSIAFNLTWQSDILGLTTFCPTNFPGKAPPMFTNMGVARQQLAFERRASRTAFLAFIRCLRSTRTTGTCIYTCEYCLAPLLSFRQTVIIDAFKGNCSPSHHVILSEIAVL